MPAHTHSHARKAIFLILLFATIAWVALLLADTRQAAPETPVRPTRPVQVPGSSLEGINEPLATIIWYRAAHDRDAAAAAARRPRPTAPPARPAAPAVRSAPTTRCPADIVALIEKHWGRFGPDVVQWAVGIAWRESNCRPDVTSPSRCAGLFQLAVPLHGDLFAAAGYDWHTAAWEAEPNIVVAANLYAAAGPGPWRL